MIDIKNDISDLSYAIDNEWLLRNTLSLEFGLSGTRQETNANVSLLEDVPQGENSEDIKEKSSYSVRPRVGYGTEG